MGVNICRSSESTTLIHQPRRRHWHDLFSGAKARDKARTPLPTYLKGQGREKRKFYFLVIRRYELLQIFASVNFFKAIEEICSSKSDGNLFTLLF